MSAWIQVGEVPPRELTEARLELHHAAQLVSIAVGRALVAHRDDDSHTTLAWRAGAGQWVGEEIPDTGGLRAGLRPSDLALTLGHESEPDEHALALAGKTLEDGLAWLRRELGRDAVAFDFHFEMPHHPVADGAAFRSELKDGFEELGRYFANGTLLLEAAAVGRDNASIIRTWPHHFDVGMLLPEGDRGVGPGLAPGDEHFDEPYLYVNVWPRPESSQLPPLPRGHWQTEGFFAAILTATELLEGSGEGQEERASEFLAAAIDGGLALTA